METSSVIGTMRTAISFAERLQNAELLQKLLDAQSGLMETIASNLELKTELNELRDEVNKLRTTLAIKEDLQFVRGLYYPKSVVNDRGEVTDVDVNPVCQRCLEIDHVVTHVQWIRVLKQYQCHQCKSTYTDHDH